MIYQSAAPKTALVFDWGNTVMKVFGQYSGPMSSWPEVAEVDGVVEALEQLKEHYPMVIATNAADSHPEQVTKALRRVGLGEYFKAVFTSRQLGASKPQAAFFRSLESVLDHPAHQLVMIGDDYRADICGAKAAGWRAIWYNPARRAAPGLLALHDGEVGRMIDLPEVVSRLTLPDHAACLAWLLERGTPYNILAHIQLVAAISYQLAVWLNAAGQAVDPVLTQRGAMLHDLSKMDSIRQARERGSGGDHAAQARDLLLERGQPELAEIANRHMPYQDPQDPRRPITWEQRLVHYADKLAEGSQLVPLEERLRALKGRYPQYAGELEDSLPVLSGLQDEICAHLHISPDQLIDQLREAVGEKR